MKCRLSVLLRLLVVLLMLSSAWSAKAQYDIDQFFFRGQRALMDGQYTQAINNFNIIIRLDSDLYEAYFSGVSRSTISGTSEVPSRISTGHWNSILSTPWPIIIGPLPAAVWAITMRR